MIYENKIDNNLDNGPIEIKDSPNDAASFLMLVESLFYCLADLVTEVTVRSIDDFITSHHHIIYLLLHFENIFFDPNDQYDRTEFQRKIMRTMLLFLLNLTAHELLVPVFIEANYASAMIKWIDGSSFKSLVNNMSKYFLGILYNLSRNNEGLKSLRKEKAFGKLIKLKSFFIEEEKEEEKKKSFMHIFGSLLISLAESDEEKKVDEDLFRQTTETLFKNLKIINDNSDDLIGDGYYLSELLHLLLQAFSNKIIVKNVFGDKSKLKTDSILFFGDLLSNIYGVFFDQEADDLEKSAGKYLLEVILFLTKDQIYLEVLKSHFILYVLIKSLAQNPKQMIANKIWGRLSGASFSNNESKFNQQPTIYVSYSLVNKKFYNSFIKDLCENFPMEILDDHEEIAETDDRWDYLAQRIQSGTVVVILISSAYENNDKTLIYVTNRAKSYGKKIFIVEAESNITFSQPRLQILLKDKDIIPYNTETKAMVKKVRDFLTVKTESSTTSTSSNTWQSTICTII